MNTITKKQQLLDEQNEAKEKLRDMLKPGDKVYTVLRHVSKSGMMRHISLHIARNNEVVDITWLVRRALDEKVADNGGIKVGGCGMDMGFDLVYRLGYSLWPNGYDCIGEGCPSNDHFNESEGKHHNNGGYALKQSWV